MKTKICTKCGIKKPFLDFHRNNQSKDGYRPDCKECHNKNNRFQYLQNKNYIDKKHREYYYKNREKITEKHIKYNRHKYHTNKEFRITWNFRRRLLRALNGNMKITTSKKLLGCTPKQLKTHLESKFKTGMSWGNYGLGDNGRKEWHIDHIKPCASFDLSKEEDQRACFHYTNLQPLWAEDNWKKSDTVLKYRNTEHKID